MEGDGKRRRVRDRSLRLGMEGSVGEGIALGFAVKMKVRVRKRLVCPRIDIKVVGFFYLVFNIK
jgi:hypothetical protein